MDILASKILSLFLLLILTLIFGILPYLYNRCRNSRLQSQMHETILHLLNAFAGGVFLGTCLLHLLAEGREELEEALATLGKKIDYPLFESIAAVGFFMICLVDFIADSCLRNRIVVNGEYTPITDSGKHTRYETIQTEGSMRIDAEGRHSGWKDNDRHQPNIDVMVHDSSKPRSSSVSSHTHDFSQVFKIQSTVKAILLLVALSFHTIFDGLAVGLQDSSSDVWQVMVAVGIHKSLVAFCLGLQLFNAYENRPLVAGAMLIFFSLMSPIGLGIGIGITSGSVNNASKLLASSILQALATGTFLYVTFFEILRESLMSKRSIWNLVVSAIGFAAMAGVKVLDTD